MLGERRTLVRGRRGTWFSRRDYEKEEDTRGTGGDQVDGDSSCSSSVAAALSPLLVLQLTVMLSH
jgi:hypothetical protein